MPDDACIQQSDSGKNDSRIVVGLLAALFVLAPFFPQNVYADFAFFYRSSVLLLFLLVAYRLGSAATLGRLRNSPLLAPACAQAALMLAGLFYTPDVYNAQTKLSLTFGVFVLYAVILAGPISERIFRALLWSLVIGGALAAFHGLFTQWVGHAADIQSLKDSAAYPDDMKTEMIRSLEANRALGRFGNPNQLAGYLVLTLWPLWILWKQTKSNAARGLLAFLAALMVWGTYRTFSRSGLLLLAAALILLIGYELHQRGLRISWKIAAGAAGGCAGVLLMAVMLAPIGFLGGRLLTISTIVARTHFFRGALHIIADHPWIGVGPEGFEQYYCAVLRPGDMEARYAHNAVLESAVEGGILGVLILLWMLASVFRSLAREGKNRPALRVEIFAAFGAALSLFLISLVDFHNNLAEMWLCPAVLLAWTHRRNAPAVAGEKSRWLVSAAVGALIAAWIPMTLCRYWNENARTDGHFLALDQKKYEARVAYERAVLYDRTDAESLRQLSLFWAEIPNPAAQQRRLQYLERAVYWAPRRASIRADYADALFALGYTSQALEQILEAQRLFPARPIYYDRAAAYYRFFKQDNEAEKQIQKANEIKKEIEANRL